MNLSSKKLTIMYCGHGYFGWQIQSAEGQKTIQGELYDVFKRLSPNSEIKIIGSGRTDAGVHALHQVARVDGPDSFENDKLLKAVNSLLPATIRVMNIESCTRDFHPVYDAIKKEYRYYFTMESSPHPFLRHMIANIKIPMETDAFSHALAMFVGEHDFVNFSCKGTDVKTTVRSIYEAEYFAPQSLDLCGMEINNLHCFRFVGNGFLKQMVRQLVGTVWSYARGQTSSADIKLALEGKSEMRCGSTAPSEGLYLYHVSYKN